jgi:hypothetical protein
MAAAFFPEGSMNRRSWLALACALALVAGAAWGGRAEAGYHHYYSSWHPSPYHYYYRSYYYKPNAYDYVIYYPQKPRYLYYYNPVAKTYWGRFDIKTKGYSLLAEEDRKGAIKDIPENAFPEPGELPGVHGDKDADKVQAPPTDDLPTDLPAGEDVGTKTDTKVDAKTDTKADGEEKVGVTPTPPVKVQAPAPGGDGSGDTVIPAKPAPDEGSAAPAPGPKPAPPDGGADPAPSPKPAPPDGGAAPAPGPKPAPPAGDAPPIKLPPGKSGCDKNCPNK